MKVSLQTKFILYPDFFFNFKAIVGEKKWKGTEDVVFYTNVAIRSANGKNIRNEAIFLNNKDQKDLLIKCSNEVHRHRKTIEDQVNKKRSHPDDFETLHKK